MNMRASLMTHASEDQAAMPDTIQWIEHILKAAHSKAIHTPGSAPILVTTYIGTLLEKQLKQDQAGAQQLLELLQITPPLQNKAKILCEIGQDLQRYVESVISGGLSAHDAKYQWSTLNQG